MNSFNALPSTKTSIPSSFREVDPLLSMEYSKLDEISLSFAVIVATTDPSGRFSDT